MGYDTTNWPWRIQQMRHALPVWVRSFISISELNFNGELTRAHWQHRQSSARLMYPVQPTNMPGFHATTALLPDASVADQAPRCRALS